MVGVSPPRSIKKVLMKQRKYNRESKIQVQYIGTSAG